MDYVWITHPNLGRKIRVSASSLPHHQRAGWVETDPPPPPPQPEITTSEASADAGASSLPKTESPKGRRTKGDEQ